MTKHTQKEVIGNIAPLAKGMIIPTDTEYSALKKELFVLLPDSIMLMSFANIIEKTITPKIPKAR